MRKVLETFTKNCPIIRHVSFLLLATLSFQSMAEYVELNPALLNPLAEIKYARTPANFTPTDETGYIPMVQEVELEVSERLKDDRSGTLKSMKSRLDSWQEREEYAEVWGLHSTGLYNTPDESSKKAYIERSFLRYFDRRLSGELKNSKKGSALAKARTIEQALRPDAKMQVSKNVKIRFSARVIQRYVMVKVVNPYVKSEVKVTTQGQINMKISKHFKKSGVKTQADYNYNTGRYVASLNKRITNRWSANVKSEQAH
ncbi:MAG: hypothetical protein KAG61_08465, partial [Bacteriovoracaceae bacterium]|nr:hypothetical protein [Bacteriovoracaceae bacterium]